MDNLKNLAQIILTKQSRINSQPTSLFQIHTGQLCSQSNNNVQTDLLYLLNNQYIGPTTGKLTAVAQDDQPQETINTASHHPLFQLGTCSGRLATWFKLIFVGLATLLKLGRPRTKDRFIHNLWQFSPVLCRNSRPKD